MVPLGVYIKTVCALVRFLKADLVRFRPMWGAWGVGLHTTRHVFDQLGGVRIGFQMIQLVVSQLCLRNWNDRGR